MTTAPPFRIQNCDSEPVSASHWERACYHWKQFTNEFPTEKDCVEALYSFAYGHCIKCLECGSKRIRKLKDSRVIVCNVCKKEAHTLAGTFFHNIRRARPWLGAILFMGRGVRLNASEFARLAHIVSASAQVMFKKLSLVVVSSMSELPEISSGEFILTFGKRSRLTPAGEPPIAEQFEIEKQHTAELEKHTNPVLADGMPALEKSELKSGKSKELGRVVGKKELSDLERLVFESISTEPIDFDTLRQCTAVDMGNLAATVVVLELKGLIKRNSGDRFSLTPSPTPPGSARVCLEGQVKAFVESFIEYVRTTFFGISRKYLQNYLGWYWCIVDRKRWTPETLLRECSGFRKTIDDDILRYDSPAMVKISLAQAEPAHC